MAVVPPAAPPPPVGFYSVLRDYDGSLASNTALGTGYVDHTTYDSITEMSALFEIPFACEQKCNELHLASLLTPGLQSDCHAIQLDWNSKRCNYFDIDVAGYITGPVQTLLSDNDYYFDPLASYDRQIPAYAGTVTWYRNVYAPPKAPPPTRRFIQEGYRLPLRRLRLLLRLRRAYTPRLCTSTCTRSAGQPSSKRTLVEDGHRNSLGMEDQSRRPI